MVKPSPHRIMIMTALLFLLVGLLVGSGVLWSATSDLLLPGIKATIAPASAPLGSTARLTLIYRLPHGGKLPETLHVEGLEKVTVLHRDMKPGTITMDVLVDQLDTWETEEISLTYLDQTGTPQHLTAPAVTITVLSVLGEKPEEATLRPIEGIESTRNPWTPYLPWIAGITALAGIVFALWWWRRKRRVETVLAEILDPPHVQAKRALKRLNEEKWFETGQVKKYYFRFSEILRQYLGAIRGFGAVELTTEEIAACVHHQQDRSLVELLREADLVKFSDAMPTVARKEEQWSAAILFIEDTSPRQESGKPDGIQEGRGA